MHVYQERHVSVDVNMPMKERQKEIPWVGSTTFSYLLAAGKVLQHTGLLRLGPRSQALGCLCSCILLRDTSEIFTMQLFAPQDCVHQMYPDWHCMIKGMLITSSLAGCLTGRLPGLEFLADTGHRNQDTGT